MLEKTLRVLRPRWEASAQRRGRERGHVQVQARDQPGPLDIIMMIIIIIIISIIISIIVIVSIIIRASKTLHLGFMSSTAAIDDDNTFLSRVV